MAKDKDKDKNKPTLAPVTQPVPVSQSNDDQIPKPLADMIAQIGSKYTFWSWVFGGMFSLIGFAILAGVGFAWHVNYTLGRLESLPDNIKNVEVSLAAQRDKLQEQINLLARDVGRLLGKADDVARGIETQTQAIAGLSNDTELKTLNKSFNELQTQFATLDSQLNKLSSHQEMQNPVVAKMANQLQGIRDEIDAVAKQITGTTEVVKRRTTIALQLTEETVEKEPPSPPESRRHRLKAALRGLREDMPSGQVAIEDVTLGDVRGAFDTMDLKSRLMSVSASINEDDLIIVLSAPGEESLLTNYPIVVIVRLASR